MPRAVTIIAPLPIRRSVQLVDPSAFTPPYDRALAAALARAGAEVELLTSRFLYGAGARGRGLPGRASASTAAAPPAASRRPAAAPSRPPSTSPTCCAFRRDARRRRRPLPVADAAGARRPPAAAARARG